MSHKTLTYSGTNSPLQSAKTYKYLSTDKFNSEIYQCCLSVFLTFAQAKVVAPPILARNPQFAI